VLNYTQLYCLTLLDIFQRGLLPLHGERMVTPASLLKVARRGAQSQHFLVSQTCVTHTSTSVSHAGGTHREGGGVEVGHAAVQARVRVLVD
jgi:hypothetical protein